MRAVARLRTLGVIGLLFSQDSGICPRSCNYRHVLISENLRRSEVCNLSIHFKSARYATPPPDFKSLRDTSAIVHLM